MFLLYNSLPSYKLTDTIYCVILPLASSCDIGDHVICIVLTLNTFTLIVDTVPGTTKEVKELKIIFMTFFYSLSDFVLPNRNTGGPYPILVPADNEALYF